MENIYLFIKILINKRLNINDIIIVKNTYSLDLNDINNLIFSLYFIYKNYLTFKFKLVPREYEVKCLNPLNDASA